MPYSYRSVEGSPERDRVSASGLGCLWFGLAASLNCNWSFKQSLCRKCRTGYGPHESCKFPCCCRDYSISVFASDQEFPESAAESDLCFPGNLPYLLGQTVQPCEQDSAFAGRMTVGVRCFRERSSHMAITGLGDAASPGSAAAGMFSGHQPQVGHQLLGRIEPGQVAKFGNRCGRDNQGHPA
jgi:hypothetical protein